MYIYIYILYIYNDPRSVPIFQEAGTQLGAHSDNDINSDNNNDNIDTSNNDDTSSNTNMNTNTNINTNTNTNTNPNTSSKNSRRQESPGREIRGPPFCPGESRPSKIRVGTGRAPEFPDFPPCRRARCAPRRHPEPGGRARAAGTKSRLLLAMSRNPLAGCGKSVACGHTPGRPFQPSNYHK